MEDKAPRLEAASLCHSFHLGSQAGERVAQHTAPCFLPLGIPRATRLSRPPGECRHKASSVGCSQSVRGRPAEARPHEGGPGEGRRCPPSAHPLGARSSGGHPSPCGWGCGGAAETQTCRRQIPQGWRRRMGSQDRTRKMPLSPRPPPTQTALWPRRSSGRGKDWGRGPVFCLRASWERWESPSTPTCFHFQQSA